MNYSKNPLSTIISNQNILSKPSLIKSSSALSKPQAVCKYNHHLLNETDEFRRRDKNENFIDLNDSICSAGFSFKRIDNPVIPLNTF